MFLKAFGNVNTIRSRVMDWKIKYNEHYTVVIILCARISVFHIHVYNCDVKKISTLHCTFSNFDFVEHCLIL